MAGLVLVAASLFAAPTAYAVCTDDAHEDDDSVAQANALDSTGPIAAQSCTGDLDYFRVFVEAGNSLTVTVTPEATFDVVLDVLNGDGSLSFSQDEGVDGEEENVDSFAVVTHYALFRVRGAGTDEGAYNIVATGVPVPQPIAALDVPDTDDLDWLDPDSASSSFDPGWRISESGTNGRADGSYAPGDGSDATGDTYSYGNGVGAERAFGALREGSSTFFSRVTRLYRNDTGSTITSLDVSYTGELWRLGATGRTDRLDFSYSTDFTNFVDIDALDFATPNISGPTGALDGNSSGNRAAVSATINGLDVAAGEHFFIRWRDSDITGLEDGLAIDDLSVTAPTPPPDADGDGVPDASDVCPDTPSGEAADPTGCAPSQLDSDGDGVTNDLDECPDSVGDDVGPDGCYWQLSVTKKGKGTVKSAEDPPRISCGVDCDENYASLSDVTLKAKPKRGYRFARWEGDCFPEKTNPCVLTVDTFKSAHAVFKKR